MPIVRHGVCVLLAMSIAAASVVSGAVAQSKKIEPPAVPAPKSSGLVMTTPKIDVEPLPFSALPGWGSDDHAAAFAAFVKSCVRLEEIAVARSVRGATDPAAAPPPPPALLAVCDDAIALDKQHGGNVARPAAKAFFEARFVPHRVREAGTPGLLTGYYEPEIKGSRTKTAAFPVPLRRRPADLVNLVAESARAGMSGGLTHARKTAAGTEPYATRSEIDQGALAGRNLEFVYLADEVEKFFLQVQGSGRIAFGDGTAMRVSYDGKNGHPYTSIGRYLIDKGIIAADRMSLAALGSWLRANPTLAREVMWQNKSYVFFRELPGTASGPLGVHDMPLTPGRSLAVDTRFHDLGMPIHIVAPTLAMAGGKTGLARLVVAQDVGSAIRGGERGDLFFGSGEAAGRLAGVTKHPVSFYVLKPVTGGAAERAKP